MKPAIALALLALSACSVDTSTNAQPIIGGQTTTPTEYPTVVALEESPGQWFCTGTLIASQWVLTAAHCVAESTTVNVRFDDPDVNDDANGRVVATAEVHSHPGFNWNDWDNDIALVKLAEAITDRAPTPIDRNVVPSATQVVDVGYGVADNNNGGGGILRKVDKVTADCAGANDPAVSGANLLCMDASDGRGSCFGDSGGPTFETINSKLVVAGVTSGGTGDLCGAGWDLYTSVHAELEFIDSIMGPPPPPPDDDAGSGSGSGSGSGDPQQDPMGDPSQSGGCNSGGGNAGWLVFALVALAGWRRRH